MNYIKGKQNPPFIYLYPLIFSVYFISMFLPDIVRPGIITSFVIIIIFFLFAVSRKISFNKLDILVMLYFVYNMLLVFISFINGYPLSVGISEFANSGIPILLYFVAKSYFKFESKFFDYLFYTFILLFIISLFLYFYLPEIYVDYLKANIAYFNIDTYLADRRLNSLTGSIGIGFLAAFSLHLSLFKFKNRKRFFYLLGALLSTIIILLSMQRAAYLLAFLIIIFDTLTITRKKKFIVSSLLFAFFAIAIFAADYFFEYNFLQRFIQIGTGISERSHQWRYINEIGVNIIWGNGLGTMSHQSFGISKLLINDGGYFKLLGELGIIGMLIFLFFLILLFKSTNKSSKHLLVFIGIFLFHLIVSNTIFYMDLAPLFWIVSGFVSGNSINTKMKGSQFNENMGTIPTSIS